MKTKLKHKPKPLERDPECEYALYSDDDGVCMYENENDAIITKQAWIKAGANGVKGPFQCGRHRGE